MPDSPVAPVFATTTAAGRGIRTPKTAELVARTLRGMIVDGELSPGDHLPNEAELMEHFSISRPTLREAIRVLEAERLVEVRRGSRSGAKVCVPGPEAVARPASLLLELSGATVSDVYRALEAVEPAAARLLTDNADEAAIDALEQFLDEVVPVEYASGRFARVTAAYHLRMVQLSGSPTLALIAGMVHEIVERSHVSFAQEHVQSNKDAQESNYKLFLRSQRRFIKLLRAGDADAAAAQWQKHMVVARQSVMLGREDLRVQDLLD